MQKLLPVVLLGLAAVPAAGNDFPHTGDRGIPCTSCHTWQHGGRTAFVSGGPDDTRSNRACLDCHKGGGAPRVVTHSSQTTSNRYGDADNDGKPGWTVECKTCHSPHRQGQIQAYAAEGYLYVGVVSNVTPTRVTCTTAEWKPDQFTGTLLFPTANPTALYQVVSNTVDTLEVTPALDVRRFTVGTIFAIAHGGLIRGQVVTPNGGSRPVRLFRSTGRNSFADGDSTRDGICEVCHTRTTYSRADGSGAPGHHEGERCVGCHVHERGFKAPACGECHGTPPTGTASLVSVPSPTGSTTAGAHQKHLDKGMECGQCHEGSVGTGPLHGNDGRVTLGFSLFGGTLKGGRYDGQAAVSYNAASPSTVVTHNGSASCSSVYCHGQNPDGTSWGGGKDTAPAWDGAVTCTSCHGGSGPAALPAAHAKHTDETTYGYACERCHADTVTGSTAIKDASKHVNHVKDVALTGPGSFDSNTAACSATSCHTNGRGGLPNLVPTWTTPMSGCTACHNGQTGESVEMNTGGHDRLVSSRWVRHYPCSYCHAATAGADGKIRDFTNHVDGKVEVTFDAKWSITGRDPPSFDSATGTCSNLYCHSDGTTVDPEVRSFGWKDGRTECNTCHGHPTTDCHRCHDASVTEWPAGSEWRSAVPMYTNTGPGTPRANSHLRHLQTNYSCDECHARTIVNGTCKDCHKAGLPPGHMGEVNHINPAYHVNKVRDVYFKRGGTYNPLSKTCSNTACHTGPDPQWGDSAKNAVLCFTCHGTSGNDVDDYGKFNDTRARISMPEWEASGHGRTTATGNYPSGNPPAAFPGNPCWYCHDNAVLHNDTTNPYRLKKHKQSEARFEKECVYCHMEHKDEECQTCHNSSESLAPQLADITAPTDHRPILLNGTSCVTACHVTDNETHKTGSGTWTAADKADVRNQYVMLGVCLQCHEDDSNGRCTSCHVGPQYKLGYDPGTGYITAASKATSSHFGYKHFQELQSTGISMGGKFCWDCHDPHGDSNIEMVHSRVATSTDGQFGLPRGLEKVTFSRKQTGADYARSAPPFDGICNVCHVQGSQHYRANYGDLHNAGFACTQCHEHKFTDSHSSGQACNTCHQDRPAPDHTGFGLPRDCRKCHKGIIGERADVMAQLRGNSHHVQGTEVTNRHCYACHWEATEFGLVNSAYHQGYDPKRHVTVKNAQVDLVIWGSAQRPTAYVEGVTGTTFTASKVGTANERAEVTKLSGHCLGCHNDANAQTPTFSLVDPSSSDCRTPRQYSWDGTSVAARYLQSGATTWGKYTGVTNAAPKNAQKAFSAHGNAVANQGGWSTSTGVDAVLPNTRNGGQNVQCYDCHNSHGSRATGITSSYVTFNGTRNGGNLKETQAGKGGYKVTYKPSSSTTGVNPYSAGAGLCFDCHETPTAGAFPWGYTSTFGATQPILGYRDGSRFGTGARGVTTRMPFKASREVMGGHLKASAALSNAADGNINGLCTPCHDPHGVTPTLGTDQAYGVPLLKGTWLTSPYKEDNPMAAATGTYYFPPTPTIFIDQNTFGAGMIAETPEQFGGLCLRCHPKEKLTDGVAHNTAWKSLDRVHESVKGWGLNAKHNYSCSKCHQAHNSGLPRLLTTNGLDTKHRGRVVSGGVPSSGSRGSFPMGQYNLGVNCHPTGTWPDNTWNKVSQW